MAPPGLLAELTAQIAERVERSVYEDRLRADRDLRTELRQRRDLGSIDQRFIAEAVFSLFRWRGWVEPLGDMPIEQRLLVSVLLEVSNVPAPCRVWASRLRIDPGSLIPLGDAPTWKARSEGFRRLVGDPSAMADPWRLFPAWFRGVLPPPPSGGSAKGAYSEFLAALQSRPPLWVRVQGGDERVVWDELRGLGIKPWVHRRLTRSGRLDPDVDVYHLPAFEGGRLEIQDLASQAVGLICDPEPGERWWDACAGAGGKALHLADLMRGKGVVIATDTHAGRLKETARRARRGPHTNISTKSWDGKGVAGRPSSFDGVLVDAPCSGIGTWRRNPDARWTLEPSAIDRLAELQARLLREASAGVKVGGTLVYSVCTLNPAETTAIVEAFLAERPGFRLDSFTNPLTESVCDGLLRIWPQEADTDAMFVARMVRKAE